MSHHAPVLPSSSPTPSLEWDYTSSHDSPSYHRSLPLDRVVNLNSVLPLPPPTVNDPSDDPYVVQHRLHTTSTPLSPRSRVSNLRRALPIERDQAKRMQLLPFFKISSSRRNYVFFLKEGKRHPSCNMSILWFNLSACPCTCPPSWTAMNMDLRHSLCFQTLIRRGLFPA